MSETFSNIVRTNNRVAATATLHVEFIGDLVCPYCYLGKRRLEDAMLSVRGPQDVSWYPYQINPDMPEDGMSFEHYLSLRFGSPDNVQPVLDNLVIEGKAAGIGFRFDRLTRVPNTLKAHQLMYLAETEGLDQMALAEELMSAFLVRGEDIGDSGLLVEFAVRHGLSADAANKAVSDDQVRQVVLTREGQVRSSGITGVPGFLLNRRLLMIGAQDTDAMVSAFDRAMFGEGDESVISPAVH